MSTNKNRLASLDALRGLAVLAVFVCHVSAYVTPIPPSLIADFLKWLFVQWIDWGQFGVALFFLISGFIIPTSLNEKSTVYTFAVSRFFRLYPTYWLSMAVVLLVTPFIYPNIVFSLSQVIKNMTMVPKLLGAEYMNGVYWTLLIEFLFYINCVVLFKMRLLGKPLVYFLIALVCNLSTSLALLANQYTQFHIPVQFMLFHLSFLFAGSLLRSAVFERNQNATRLTVILFIVFAFNLSIITGTNFAMQVAREAKFILISGSATLTAYAAATTFFILIMRAQALDDVNALRRLGKVSYSFYLFHMPIISILAKLINPSLSVMLFSFYFSVALILTSIFSALSYRYVEIVSMDFAKRHLKSNAIRHY